MLVKSEESAKELLNDVFISIWKQREKLPEIQNFDAYIYKVSKFTALNYLRSIKIKIIDIKDIDISLFANTITTPESQLISYEEVSAINTAIEDLPDRCKLIFKLVREDKMKYKEVAELLDISTKTIENQLAIATSKIRETLKNSEK